MPNIQGSQVNQQEQLYIGLIILPRRASPRRGRNWGGVRLRGGRGEGVASAVIKQRETW